MTQAEAIAFDLDDTLCDYKGAKDSALMHLAATISKSKVVQEGFIAAYHLSEPRLFRSFLTKNISIEDYRTQRFHGPLTASRLNPSPTVLNELNAEYMRRCNEEVQLFPEALDVLRTLYAERVPLALITNGPSDGQRTKIHALGIDHYFDTILISSETMIAKPDARIYAKAAYSLCVNVNEMLMVGDSMNDDYHGALSAGAQAVLMDRDGRAAKVPGIKRITNLKELLR